MSDELSSSSAGGQPAGHALSGALRLPVGPGAAALRRTIGAIDRVHGDGELPVVVVELTLLPPGQAADYTFLQSGEPTSIRVSRIATRPELAFVHEVGHLLDHQALGSDRSRFASEVEPELEDWRLIARRSDAVRTLVRYKLDPAGVPADLQPYLTYLLSDEEVFARSYAQWIALRSGDATLQAQVASRRQRKPDTLFIPLQWDDDDFEPIAATLDRTFHRRGWRR